MKAKLLQRMATSVPGTFDWRSATVEVYGKSRLMSEVHGGKLYHGSGAELPPGTILVPGIQKNFRESSGEYVSVTSDPSRAKSWTEKSGATQVHVYEVEPLYRSEEHTSELQSLRHLVCRLLLEKKKQKH